LFSCDVASQHLPTTPFAGQAAARILFARARDSDFRPVVTAGRG